MSTLKNNVMVMPQELMTSSATQGTDLGAMATTGDGRYFRYVLAGGSALVPGKLQQGPAEDTTNFENLAVATVAIGATSIATTTTVTLTANQLAGGILSVTTGTGAGYQYRIKGNTAATGAVTTITLEDPFQTVTSGTTRIDMMPSPFNGVILNPSTASSTPVGVAVYPIAAGQYGWIQTHGVATVLADGAITVGTSLCASNGVNGAVEPFAGVQAPIGYAVTGIATTEYGQVFLTID